MTEARISVLPRTHPQQVSHFVLAALQAPLDNGHKMHEFLASMQQPTEEHAKLFRRYGEQVIAFATTTMDLDYWRDFTDALCSVVTPSEHLSCVTKAAMPHMVTVRSVGEGPHEVELMAAVTQTSVIVEGIFGYTHLGKHTLAEANVDFFERLIQVVARLLVIDCCTPDLAQTLFPIVSNCSIVGFAIFGTPVGLEIDISFGSANVMEGPEGLQ